MTEIEKMYKNAGVEPQYKKRTECKDGYTVGHPCEKGIACINCNRSVFEDVMPPFTAEKQLELIKWLSEDDTEKFEEALSGLINDLWQDLTDQEKEEIRGILNE